MAHPFAINGFKTRFFRIMGLRVFSQIMGEICDFFAINGVDRSQLMGSPEKDDLFAINGGGIF